MNTRVYKLQSPAAARVVIHIHLYACVVCVCVWVRVFISTCCSGTGLLLPPTPAPQVGLPSDVPLLQVPNAATPGASSADTPAPQALSQPNSQKRRLTEEKQQVQEKKKIQKVEMRLKKSEAKRVEKEQKSVLRSEKFLATQLRKLVVGARVQQQWKDGDDAAPVWWKGRVERIDAGDVHIRFDNDDSGCTIVTKDEFSRDLLERELRFL